MAFVDEHDLESLTLRALGQRLSMHHTAIYRHFTTRAELIAAMIDIVLQEAVEAAGPNRPEVRDDLIALGQALRHTFSQHPNLLPALITIPAPTKLTRVISRRAIDLLERAGLQGDAVIRWLMIFEAFAVGAPLYDFAGAPHHLQVRATRYRSLESPVMTVAAADLDDLGRRNEEAFTFGLENLADLMLREAHSHER